MSAFERPPESKLCDSLHKSGLDIFFKHNQVLSFLLTEQFDIACMNRSACLALHLRQHQTEQVSFLDFVHADQRDEVESLLKAALNGAIEHTIACLLRPNSVFVSYELLLTPFVSAAGIAGAIVAAYDLTELHDAQSTLFEAQAQYRTFYQTHPEPIFTIDREGTFTQMNSAALEFLGNPDPAILQKQMIDYVTSEQQEETREMFRLALAGKVSQHETSFRRADGSIVQLSITAVPSGDPAAPSALHCIARDVTTERLTHDTLRVMAYTDARTGLLNRSAFDRDLTSLVDSKTEFTLFILDIDRLKNINDTWGRTVGDSVLQLVAQRMVDFVPQGSKIYRYTGDQFFILHLTVDHHTTHSFAAQLNDLFDAPFFVDDHAVRTTVSIGAAHYPTNASDAETLVTNTEHALISAKKQGRNRLLWWSDIADPVHRENAELAVILRQAAINGELSLTYQPQIELATDALFGVEALLRWNTPLFGQVAPDRFIKLAERSGLIVEIGSWALNQACEDFARWQQQGLNVPHISVNISMHQFQDRGFVQVVSDALTRSGIQPQQLVLEITESIAQTQEAALERMLEIQKLGVLLALDDFGTGFSSLSAVHDFPLDFLKVDRIFVTYLGEKRSAGLTTTVLDLAKNLQLTSIVEGIETQEQLQSFTSLGADVGQGFLFSRPLTSERLILWIKKRAQRI